MFQASILAFVMIFGASASNNSDTVDAKSTYLLQVSSNLNCQTLEIEVGSDKGTTDAKLVFDQGAFAAVDLAPGKHSLGTVTCHNSPRGTETFNVLENGVAPFQLQAGQAYFGGKLILLEENQGPDSSAPDVLQNCVRSISRARGAENTNCRDGVGVATSRRGARFVNVYAPKLASDEVQSIRAALSATENQLVYLPISQP